MKRSIGFYCVLSAIAFTLGCGGSTTPTKADAKKTSKSQKPAVAAAPAPPPKPKVVVSQDAYANVSQALQLYTDALKTQNATEVDRVEAWLEMNKDQSVPELGAVLKNSSSSLESQIAASRALGRCGPTAANALIDAIGVVKVDQVRVKSIESLSLLKPPSPESIKALHGLISHKESKIRQSAIQGLGRIGKPAAAVVPDLMNVLNNAKENDTVRSAAKDALVKIDPRKGFHGMKAE